MVAQVTLTELDINAIGAALDERSRRLHGELEKLAAHPPSQSREFALEVNRDAIRDTIRVRLLIAAAAVLPEHPSDMTYEHLMVCDDCTDLQEDVPESVPYNRDAWTEAEMREAWGR